MEQSLRKNKHLNLLNDFFIKEIAKETKKRIEQESKSFALWLESQGFDGRSINDYWNEYQRQFK